MAMYDITLEVLDPEVTAHDIKALLANIGEVVEMLKWKEGDQ